jgi:phosphoribosylaminoimidazolecarboxamide formyltransferase/IMP cyclohydrolase
VSVFDKAGLDRLAAALKAAGVRVASTGGTATALAKLGVSVDDVSAITGFPEVLDGRVKTLHPHIFAGILARSDRPDDIAVLAEHSIDRFDAVIVNLYDFQSVITTPDCTPAQAIELIDIGGPSLVRAAAKNHAFTSVVSPLFDRCNFDSPEIGYSKVAKRHVSYGQPPLVPETPPERLKT